MVSSERPATQPGATDGQPSERRELEAELPREIFVASADRAATDASLPSPRQPAVDTPTLDRELPQVGQTVGKYRVEAIISIGSSAVVFRGTHTTLARPVALKFLRPCVIERRPEAVELLRAEGCFAAMVDHPCVVRVHDAVVEGSRAFLVMELVEGMTLATLIAREGALSPARVARTGIEISEGLQAGLVRGLLHRDVKPANIMIGPNGSAKLLDFGLALATSVNQRPGLARGLGPEWIVGTKGYMAPEQERAPRTVDHRADIYSLGVTLREALTGRIAPQRAERGPAEGAALTRLRAFLSSMCNAQVRDRPATYRVVVDELQAALASLRR